MRPPLAFFGAKFSSLSEKMSETKGLKWAELSKYCFIRAIKREPREPEVTELELCYRRLKRTRATVAVSIFSNWVELGGENVGM